MPRLGAALTSAAGCLLIGAGSAALGLSSASWPYSLSILPATLVAGAGMAAALVGLQALVFTDTPAADTGAVSGLFTSVQEVASAVGTAAFVAIALAPAAVLTGLRLTFLIGALTAVLAAMPLLALRRWGAADDQ